MKKILTSLALGLSLLAPAAQAERLKDLASIAGVRENQLMGYGLVVGLDGSGDQTTQTPFTVQAFTTMLSLVDPEDYGALRVLAQVKGEGVNPNLLGFSGPRPPPG